MNTKNIVLSREPYHSDSVATWLSNMEKAFEEANHEFAREGAERDVESLESEDEEDDDSWWSSSPFSSSSFLNTWFRSAHVTPWWKGKNVCTSREEDLAPFAGSSFWSSSLQTQSCYDDSESYVCVSKSTTDDGKSIRTLNITRQCCHGYRRGRNGCYEVDLKTVMETLEKIGASEYMDIVKSSGLTAMFTDSNLTVFAFGDATAETTTPKLDDNNEPSAVATPVPEFEPEPTTEPDIDNELTVPAYRKRREASLPYNSKLHYHSSKPLRYKRSQTTRAKRQAQMPVMSSIAPGFHKLSGHVDETVINSAADGSVIRLNLFRGPNASRRFTANCVLVTKPNIEASNGWVHKVDGPVPRADQTLAQILENEPRFSIFVGLLKSTDLWSQLEDPESHVTVMAPSNEAFEKLPADQLEAWRMGKSCSKDVIGNHLLPFTLCSTAVWTSASVRTQSNYNLPMRPDPETEGLLLTVNNGKLISLDNSASNGVLHETDTVLIPDLARNLREALAETNKEWLKIMDEAGFDFSINNVTILAISDAELKKPEAVKMMEEAIEKPNGLNELVMFYTAPGMSTKERSEQSPCDDDIIPLGSQGWLDPLVAGSRPRLFVSSPPMPFRAAHLPSIQCKPIEQVTALCDGARLIQLKKLLEWPKKSLLELVTSDPNLSTFSQLIKKSEKWSQKLRSMDSDPVTLIASTDDAWKEISETDLTQLDENPKLVDSIIGAHIINEPICCESAPTWPFTGRAVTVDGDSVGLRRDVNGQVNVGKASLEVCNRHATNGIMHLSDTVMFPRLYKQLGGWLLEGNRDGNHHNVDTMLFGI